MSDTLAKTLPTSDGVQAISPQKPDAAAPELSGFELDRAAIFLDIDGTLLDIAPTPLEVNVPDALRQALGALHAKLDGAIAFISGRPVAEIDRLFHPLQLAAVGGHGAEIRPAPKAETLRSQCARLDDDLRADFAHIGRIGPNVIVEDKGYSLAIHYRLAPELGGEIMKRVTSICKDERCDTLEILPGKAVVEIKPGGYSKGTGLRELMGMAPFQGRRPIFIGDDVTDNAAFAALPDFNGTGFSVGGIVPGAVFNFDGPQDVRRWLQHLAEIPEAG